MKGSRINEPMNKREIKKSAISLLYPATCRFCGRPVEIYREACDSCAENIHIIKENRCHYCGCGKDSCGCGKRKNHYSSVAAPYYYEGAAEKAVYRLKFMNDKSVLKGLCLDMAQSLADLHGEGLKFDFITFVPSAEGENPAREFNQAELIAEVLSVYLKIPAKPLLTKLYATERQHMLPAALRSGNILGVFDIIGGAEIKDADILLADDIKTTGSTLNECAKVLLTGGVKSVHCVTATLTRKRREPDDGRQNAENLKKLIKTANA
ncbi:MAG: double zinc ribbon domain-containing protein [Oscillospiraceae bacterium]|nr:double zinc ribbon domain-containing protein [Oscillospiraceae bacterium]